MSEYPELDGDLGTLHKGLHNYQVRPRAMGDTVPSRGTNKTPQASSQYQPAHQEKLSLFGREGLEATQDI